jgi:hypothetical protein
LLQTPGKEGRRKVRTTPNRPHFHQTVTSQPPSLPNFREIQMWAQRGVRYLLSRWVS